MRRLIKVAIAIVVLVGLLIGLDFVARAYAENRLASQLQQKGFTQRPNVSIGGFPFLTQVIGHDLQSVQVSSTNVREGPVVVSNLSAQANGVHLNSGYNGGTVSMLTGTLRISFPALSHALSSLAGPFAALAGSALTLQAAGPDEVRASMHVAILGGSAVWRITQVGRDEFRLRAVSGLGSVPAAWRNFTIPLPSLPLGLTIQHVRVSPQGVIATLIGHNVPFGQ